MAKPPPRLIDRPPYSRSYASTSSTSSSNTKPFPHYPNYSIRHVKWGISWHPPALMIVYFLSGTALAITHHFYFTSLHATLAGSPDRQQWATGIGTALSFLVVALLRAATCAAYAQYAWTLVRRQGFEMATIDKLFSLTTDPMGFWGGEMWRKAKIGMIVAGMCWITPLAGIAPPATLSVVPGLVVDDVPTSMAAMDWNSPAFYDIQPRFSLPSSIVVGIATQAALSRTILPLEPPAANSTFKLQFYGPAVQCSPANSTQQKILDYYNNVTRVEHAFLDRLSLEHELRNASQFKSSRPPTIADFDMLVFSAFAPYTGIQGWLFGISTADDVDQFNNWNVDLPWEMEELGSTVDSALYDDVVQQLFVQTSTGGFVCLMGNASYDIEYEFIDGIQTSINYTTADFKPVVMMRSGDGASGGAMQTPIVPGPYARRSHTGFELSYMAVWQSFTSLISGNVSFGYVPLRKPNSSNQDYNLTLNYISSRILLNGLSACDDIVRNHWSTLPFTLPDSEESPVTFFNSANETGRAPNQIFNHPSSMCRNNTLMKAIEDLAGNITLSMLSSASLTSPNSTLVNVTYQTTKNVYRYDSTNLLISYGAVIIITVLGSSFGVFAFFINGVAHSSAFSAILATTRNSELDDILYGHSLGAVPLDGDIAGVRLRFGELVGRGGIPTAKHVGFGFEDGVISVQKWGKYV